MHGYTTPSTPEAASCPSSARPAVHLAPPQHSEVGSAGMPAPGIFLQARWQGPAGSPVVCCWNLEPHLSPRIDPVGNHQIDSTDQVGFVHPGTWGPPASP